MATGCRLILNWLAQDDSLSFNAEQILEDAKFRLVLALPGSVPATKPAPNLSIEALIASCRPDLNPDELDVSRNSRWLLTWLSHVIPEAGMRLDAIDQALNRVCSRHWIRNL